jgi:cytochrome c553
MKVKVAVLALPVLLLSAVAVAPSIAGMSSPPTAARISVGKAQYCGFCHGASGQGYRAFYTMPQLAGQQPEYLANQLRAFAEGRRTSSTSLRMSRVHALSPAMRTSLAEQFARRSARTAGGGPRDQVATGRSIYEGGIPEANLPACAACHGSDGQGAGANPRLAGQLYSYTLRTLLNWTSERGHGEAEGPAAVMQPIASRLTRSQASALAAYVATLR